MSSLAPAYNPAETEKAALGLVSGAQDFEKRNAVPAFVEAARSVEITDQASREAAAAFRADLKARDRKAEDFFAPMKRNMDALKKSILDGEKAVRGPIAEAVAILDPKIAAFETRLLEEAAAERARLEEENRKAEHLIEAWQVDGEALDTSVSRGQNKRKILIRGRLISHQNFVILATEFGTQAVVTSSAA